MRLVTVLLAAALWAGDGRSAPAWPEVPPPPRTRHLEWVARDAVVNGLPTRVERFETELTPAEVLAHYRRQWARATVGAPRDVQGGGWHAVSTLLPEGVQVAVQVRAIAQGGSEGLISVSAFRELRRDPVPPQLPRFADTRVAQVIESVDGPLRSQLVSMVSTATFEVNLSRWRGEWQRRGWSLAFEQQPPAAGDGARAWLASFAKPPHSVDLALSWKPGDRHAFLTANLLGPAEPEPRR